MIGSLVRLELEPRLEDEPSRARIKNGTPTRPSLRVEGAVRMGVPGAMPNPIDGPVAEVGTHPKMSPPSEG